MIDVTVKLVRGHVFLCGEIVECSVSFTHPPLQTHKAQSNSDTFESLAWASAQIHCQCFTNSKVCKEDEKFRETSLASTALGASDESGQTVIATEPKILFCDLKLAPGQTKTYTYTEILPNDSPPSYRGQLVKYSYKVTIGTQRVNSPVKLLKIPIKVLPLFEVLISEVGPLCNDTSDELTPANPFLEVKQKETPMNIALQTLQNITARRNPNYYMISNKRGKVARFCLFKGAYKLGEDIIGTFDFSIATVNCMQVSVSLQCEEQAAVEIKDNNKSINKFTTYSKFHEVCLGYKFTQLVLPIPLYVTPAFSTNLVTLKWRLHFEFVTTVSENLEPPKDFEGEWRAPVEVPIETMVWSLPIKLYATTPIHVSQGLQADEIYSLTIK